MRLVRALTYRLSDALHIFREQGLRAGLNNLFETMVRVVYTQQEHVVLAKNLSASDIKAPESRPGLVIHQIQTVEALHQLAGLVDQAEAVRFRQMFQNGSVGFLALQDGQAVGWGWLSTQIDRQTNPLQVPLQPGDACLHDLFVAAAYRGQGIAPHLVARRLQYLHDHQYQRSVISCVKDNLPALKVAHKAGYTSIGESIHTRFLFWDHLDYKVDKA